jgi:hypothetical protein
MARKTLPEHLPVGASSGDRPSSTAPIDPSCLRLRPLAEYSSRLPSSRPNSRLNRATLWRWLQDEQFSRAYSKARRESVRQSIARLQQVSSGAVDCLRDVMQSPDANPAAKVSAAKAVLEFSLKAIELEDLTLRIEQLEKLLQSANDLSDKGKKARR